MNLIIVYGFYFFTFATFRRITTIEDNVWVLAARANGRLISFSLLFLALTGSRVTLYFMSRFWRHLITRLIFFHNKPYHDVKIIHYRLIGILVISSVVHTSFHMINSIFDPLFNIITYSRFYLTGFLMIVFLGQLLFSFKMNYRASMYNHYINIFVLWLAIFVHLNSIVQYMIFFSTIILPLTMYYKIFLFRRKRICVDCISVDNFNGQNVLALTIPTIVKQYERPKSLSSPPYFSLYDSLILEDKPLFEKNNLIYIMCPEISLFEWHPFSLLHNGKVLICTRGKWTNELFSLYKKKNIGNKIYINYFTLSTDNILENYYFKNINIGFWICGIGITELFNYLQYLSNNVVYGNKIFIICVAREKQILTSIDYFLRNSNNDTLNFNMKIYFTNKNDRDTPRVYGRMINVKLGRPSIKQEFKFLKNQNVNNVVAICSKNVLNKLCREGKKININIIE